MGKTVRETIKSIIFEHLKVRKSRVFGQCLTAVGWVGGTLPELYEEDGMVELSTADVAGGGIVVGAALQGMRPIYVIRYQGFNWYNAPSIANYACKSKEIWNRASPIFIRSIAMEGGIGPVGGSSHHSLFHRMPGIKIVSPMTPKEYENAYKKFMEEDDVYYVSEHRKSYDNSSEMQDQCHTQVDFVIFAISVTRFEAETAYHDLHSQGVSVGLVHIVWLKPFDVSQCAVQMLAQSRHGGVVLDDDYEDGVGKSLAHKLMMQSRKPVYVLGLEDRTAGFHPSKDNLPPNASHIKNFVLKALHNASNQAVEV